MKKLLATVASIALTGGALLGATAPAYATDSVPDPGDATSVAEAPTSVPTPETQHESVPADAGAAEEEVAEDDITTPPEQIVPADVSVPAKEPATAVEQSEDAEPAPAVEPAVAKSVVAPQSQPESRANNNKKVWVCKFVRSSNSPGGYRLDTNSHRKQPIHVSENSLSEDDRGNYTFSDQQPSFVVPEDDSSLCSREEVTVVEEVICPTRHDDGIVNVTTTTTLYYGTTEITSSTKTSTRQLTEADGCIKPPAMVYVCQFRVSSSHPSGWVLRSGSQPVLMSEGDLEVLGDDADRPVDFDDELGWFIVAEDDSSLCASQTKDVAKAVTCPTHQVDGYATITTTKTYFYGSHEVKQKVTDKVRDLTVKESKACPTVEEPLTASAAVSFSEASCDAPSQLMLGDIENATWGEVTDPDGDGSYSVTATADDGAQFEGELTELTFSGILDAQWDPLSDECDLVTLGLVMPMVTFTQASCTVDGSYTLGVDEGYDASLVTFTVNGVSGVLSGMYPITESGSVTITAQIVEPNGVEFGWEAPPEFSFLVPSDGSCNPEIGPESETLEQPIPEKPTAQAAVQLPTLALSNEPALAYTGGGNVSPLWWMLPMTMILLGAGALFVRRRADVDAS